MSYNECMKELESLGTEQTRKIYKNHGADIDLFGVSVSDIKKLAKKYKKQHELGYQLLQSNNVDAIYLSQYIVDPTKLTIDDLLAVIDKTDYYMILDNAVANLIARNKDISFNFLHDYLDSENPRYKQVAFNVYNLMIGSYDDALLDKEDIIKRIDSIKNNIHHEANRVRYNMNNFLITVGANFSDLTDTCKEYAKEIGTVEVYMGKTSCKVPDALSYIEKIEKRGTIGKKRKI